MRTGHRRRNSQVKGPHVLAPLESPPGTDGATRFRRVSDPTESGESLRFRTEGMYGLVVVHSLFLSETIHNSYRR